MKKQTAVEWLIEQLFKHGYFDASKSLTFTNLDHLQEQSKSMEKEQIIDAYNFGIKDEYVIGSEQYYNETYGGDNE